MKTCASRNENAHQLSDGTGYELRKLARETAGELINRLQELTRLIMQRYCTHTDFSLLHTLGMSIRQEWADILNQLHVAEFAGEKLFNRDATFEFSQWMGQSDLPVEIDVRSTVCTRHSDFVYTVMFQENAVVGQHTVRFQFTTDDCKQVTRRVDPFMDHDTVEDFVDGIRLRWKGSTLTRKSDTFVLRVRCSKAFATTSADFELRRVLTPDVATAPVAHAPMHVHVQQIQSLIERLSLYECELGCVAEQPAQAAAAAVPVQAAQQDIVAVRRPLYFAYSWLVFAAGALMFKQRM